MTNKVEVQVRNLGLTEKVEEYVGDKAGRLDHYLPLIEEARVELTHVRTARQASDRNVAQITVWGKGVTLRSEERADEPLAAFDAALDNLHRKIEKYKGKHYHGRGDGKSAAEVAPPAVSVEDEADSAPIVRRKKFPVLPMDELEAVEQMRLLGHESFFIFYNSGTSRFNVLYRRRDGSYGLIEPELA